MASLPRQAAALICSSSSSSSSSCLLPSSSQQKGARCAAPVPIGMFACSFSALALSATLMWKHFHTYMLVKKPFPALFYALIRASMLCFFSYVILGGGNPPRKSKSSAYKTS